MDLCESEGHPDLYSEFQETPKVNKQANENKSNKRQNVFYCIHLDEVHLDAQFVLTMCIMELLSYELSSFVLTLEGRFSLVWKLHVYMKFYRIF